LRQALAFLIDSQRTINLFADVLDMASFAKGGHRFESLSSDEVLGFYSV